MDIYEFSHSIRELIYLFRESDEFRRVLLKTKDQFDELFSEFSSVVELINDNNLKLRQVGDAQKKVGEYLTFAKTWDPFMISDGLTKFDQKIRKFEEIYGQNINISQIENSSQNFRDAYRNFVNAQNHKNSYILLERAKVFADTIISLDNIFGTLEVEINQGEEMLELKTDNEVSLLDVSKKTKALDEFYSLIPLIDISSKSIQPPILKSMNLGSFYITVFGDEKYIKIATRLLENSLQYLRDTSSAGNPAPQLPKEKDAAVSIVDVKGIQTEFDLELGDDEAISNFSVRCLKWIQEFVNGEDLVSVNRHDVPITLNGFKKLQVKRQLFLEEDKA